MNSNKQQYHKLVKAEPSIPIFSRDWWLDAVCGTDNWDVLLLEKGGEIMASLPFYRRKRYGLTLISQPLLTQHNGIWIKYPPVQATAKRLSYEKTLMNQMIDLLADLNIDWFCQNFHYSITNWLPFYWRGFLQTSRYTYVIPDIDRINLQDIFSRFSEAKRRNIKRAEQQLQIKTDLNARQFYAYHQMILAKKGEKIAYPFDLFGRIFEAAVKRGHGRTFYAADKNEQIHSALFLIWDENSAYALITAVDPDHKKSGSLSLVIKEAIRFAAAHTRDFDFEGSMIEMVENSYRQFATVQRPYFNISFMSRRMRIIPHGRGLFSAIAGSPLAVTHCRADTSGVSIHGRQVMFDADHPRS